MSDCNRGCSCIGIQRQGAAAGHLDPRGSAGSGGMVKRQNRAVVSAVIKAPCITCVHLNPDNPNRCGTLPDAPGIPHRVPARPGQSPDAGRRRTGRHPIHGRAAGLDDRPRPVRPLLPRPQRRPAHRRPLDQRGQPRNRLPGTPPATSRRRSAWRGGSFRLCLPPGQHAAGDLRRLGRLELGQEDPERGDIGGRATPQGLGPVLQAGSLQAIVNRHGCVLPPFELRR